MKSSFASGSQPGHSEEPVLDGECPDLGLWGKLDGSPGRYPLLCHLLDTSAAALEIWDQWLRPGLRALITAAVAPGDEAATRAIFATVAGLHDAGKANKIFQGQLYKQRGGSTGSGKIVDELAGAGFDFTPPMSSVAGIKSIPDAYCTVMRRHEAVSLFIAAGIWPNSQDEVAAAWVGTVVGGHHGRYHPRFAEYGDSPKAARPVLAEGYLRQLMEGKWGIQQDAHVEAVLSANGTTLQQIAVPLTGEKSTTAILLMTGLVMLADWLASDVVSVVHGQSLSIDPATEPSEWLEERRRGYFSQSITKTLGLYIDLADPVNDIMGEFADSLSPLQAAAQTVGRGLWIATETTGAGKTEAAMLRHAAVPGEGIMFALPTRATTDAMFERMSGYFSSTGNAAALLHGHRSLNSFYSNAAQAGQGLHSTSWLTDTRNALFAPVSVGTCDQVLLGGLRQKNTPVRLLALANRHVVIDEVHSFDHYQAALLEELLAWWGETDTRVTLLSASLPASVTRRYAEAYSGSEVDVTLRYPGHLTAIAQEASSKDVVSQRSYTLRVRLHEVLATQLVKEHVNRVLGYQSQSPEARIAVVVNQVDRALEIARLLAESGQRVIVLHSRMAAGHRSAVARELHEVAGKTSGHRGVIVVGTQIIESSLDLDFDHMISDLAPAPSLIQRAGRLWRSTPVVEDSWGAHRFLRPTTVPTLDVLVATDESGRLDSAASLPYLPGELRRTMGALREGGEAVGIPSDVQRLVDAAAFDPFAPDTDDLAGELELIKAGTKLSAADAVVTRMHHRHDYDRVLGENTTFREISTLTEPDELAESATRLIERPTAECFIVAPHGPSKWVWRGDVEAALHSRDPNVMRAVLALTFPLAWAKLFSRTGVEEIPGYELDDEVARRKRGPMQRNLVPVRLFDGAVYDDLLGVRLR